MISNQFDVTSSMLLTGGTFRVNGDNSLGALGVQTNKVQQQVQMLLSSLLETNYKYYPSLTFNNQVLDDYGNIFISTEKEITIIPIEGEYEIIEGENQKYNDSDIIIKSNGDYSLFQKLLVDEEEVDSSNYTVESGSTIVTLKKEFIDTLEEGNHTVTFVYENGSVSTSLTLNAPSNTNSQTTNNPQTIDNIYCYILFFICSIIMLITCEKKAIKNF